MLPDRNLGESVLARSDCGLARFLDILAPGERDLVTFVEAYFDESETEGDKSVLCLAGYIFEKDRCLKLDAEWKEQIIDEFNLPYFRMSACAHGNEPFDKLEVGERDRAARTAIKIIKEHMSQGFCISVQEHVFDRCMKPFNMFGRAYSWCCFMALVGVRHWAEETGFNGEIGYFFESGHRHQKQANAFMYELATVPEMKKGFRYAGHAFVPKEKNRPVQTADILAWHGAKQLKDISNGVMKMRADFRALAERDTFRFLGNAERFLEFQKNLDALSPEAKQLMAALSR